MPVDIFIYLSLHVWMSGLIVMVLFGLFVCILNGAFGQMVKSKFASALDCETSDVCLVVI